MSKTANKKHFIWNNKYILDENQLLEAAQKNNYYVPVLKTIRERNVYEKKNVYFQDFDHKFTIFKGRVFSE